MRTADERIDVVTLESEQIGLQSDSADVAVKDLAMRRREDTNAIDALRTVVLHAELSEERHHLAGDARGGVDIVDFVDGGGAVLHDAPNVLFGRFHIVHGGDALDGFSFVSNLQVQCHATFAQVGVVEERSDLLFCVGVQSTDEECMSIRAHEHFPPPRGICFRLHPTCLCNEEGRTVSESHPPDWRCPKWIGSDLLIHSVFMKLLFCRS